MNYFEAAQIARANDFRARMRALMTRLAVERIGNAADGSPDLLLAQRILKGGEDEVIWGLAVVTQAKIIEGAHKEDGSTIQDSEIDNAQKVLWAAFAK